MLVHKYELFKIESIESITKIFTHFIDIINKLKSLEKSYTNSELMRKILRYLSRTWKAKITAIQEVKNLNILSLEELLGSLMIHELTMKQNLEDKVKKKKTVALKSIAKKEDEESGESDERDDDEEMTLLTKKFKTSYKKETTKP